MMSVIGPLLVCSLQAVPAGRARRCCQAVTRAAVARRDAGARNATVRTPATALRAHSAGSATFRRMAALACGVFP